jgi:signal transduction histidine kinase
MVLLLHKRIFPNIPAVYCTKPKGQGTELGLSLSYDIIKAHGGDQG